MQNPLKSTEFKQNEEIILELNDGRKVVGNFYRFINEAKAGIEVQNVREYHSNQPLGGRRFYYENNIKAIKFMTEISEEASKQPAPVQSQRKTIQMTREQNVHLETTNFGVKVVNQIDVNFHEAKEDLMVQPAVGVVSIGSTENSRFGRLRNFDFLCCATFNTIYMFDALQLGDGLKKLKEVLQDKTVVKVLYDSKGLCDNLKYNFDIDVMNIFDVFVADSLLFGEVGLANLEGSVEHHLGLDIERTSENKVRVFN
jgi:hypothetical protein